MEEGCLFYTAFVMGAFPGSGSGEVCIEPVFAFAEESLRRQRFVENRA